MVIPCGIRGTVRGMQGLTVNNSAWLFHRFSQDVAFGCYVVFLSQILCFVVFILMPEFVAPS